MTTEAQQNLLELKYAKDQIARIIGLVEAKTGWSADAASVGAVMDYIDDAFYAGVAEAEELIENGATRCHKDSNANDARTGA